MYASRNSTSKMSIRENIVKCLGLATIGVSVSALVIAGLSILGVPHDLPIHRLVLGFAALWLAIFLINNSMD